MSDTSPMTGVRLENEYRVGAPSSRNASNHPFILRLAALQIEKPRRLRCCQINVVVLLLLLLLFSFSLLINYRDAKNLCLRNEEIEK
jgi:hypothetical protein